jgi:hypothetical protein
MSPLLNNSAIFENTNLVCITNGAEPMGDHNTSTGDLTQVVVHQPFRQGIEVAGCFVKDQDSGVMGQGPGQGDALELASRKPGSSLAYQCFISHRHLDYFVMNSRKLRRLDYRFQRHRWIIESYVLAN